MTLKKIKDMIESAPTKIMAIDMLNTYRTFSDVTQAQFEKGRKLIEKEFQK
jgi:hypothetical protein